MSQPHWNQSYDDLLSRAIRQFWNTRENQSKDQKTRGSVDAGKRGAVTGGKQMDGFARLMRQIAADAGIPKEDIFTNSNELPGYFRPTKKWDLLVVKDKQLLACVEFKSQVGPSFGNNYNNRVEEALGDAVDVHAAYKNKAFGNQQPFWAGYLMLVEKVPESTSSVDVKEPHFRILENFRNESYLGRYKILCHRLMEERHYDSTCLIWSENSEDTPKFGMGDDGLSFKRFAYSFKGFLLGHLGGEE
jgi:hypothetical protein